MANRTTLLLRVIDSFIPRRELLSREELMRSRALVGSLLVMAPAISVLTAVGYRLGASLRLFIAGYMMAAGYLVSLALFRLIGSLRAAALTFFIVHLIMTTVAGVHVDGRFVVLHPWNVFIPLFATFLLGARYGFGLAIAVAVQIAAIYLLHEMGHGLTAQFMPGRAVDLYTLVSMVVAGIIALVGWLYDTMRLQTLQSLDGALQQVEQANQQLEQANQQLEQANQQLEQANQQLAENMATLRTMARRIQTALLPKDLALGSAQLAASMHPAEDVGGDYYDVLPAPQGSWIGIGDVAGHGLEAGLIMLMVQSGISALTKAYPNDGPARILELLNQVVYDNITIRLASQQLVTLSLLRLFPDGRMVYAGAHEPMLIYRAHTGTCEILQTPGTWLGLVEDVDQLMDVSSTMLHEGDVLVLYTDGVVQSLNASDEQYGVERLAAELEQVGQEPVMQIRDHLLGEVERWCTEQDDDMTLLVLRYRTPQAPAPASLRM